MVRVKICGITSWADAKLALDAGAKLLGFNFYRRSPRCMTAATARWIIDRMPDDVDAVGVFVDKSFSVATEIAQAVGLDIVQLHGDESPAVVAQFARSWPVIKAFRVRRGFRSALLARYPNAALFLLDGFRPHVPGGTGRTFDWRVVRQAKRYGPIILAGGVTPENVAQAILAAQPFAVDVCSGVESKPGRKDPVRLRELMRQVEAANHQRK